MKPRVLVLTTTFPAYAGDGIPPFVLDLCRALEDNFDLTVITPRVPGAARRERIGSLSVERFAYFPRRYEGLAHGATLANLRTQPWRLVEFGCLLARFHWVANRAIARTRPQLIHAHWLLPAGLHAVGLGPRRGRTPVIVTVHGVDMHAMPFQPIQALRRFIIGRCSRVVTVSNELADRVRQLDGSAAIDIVPMGANLAEVPSSFQRSPQDGLVGFIGRLAEKKGVSVLLDALALVPDLHLIVAGDGPERNRLETQAGAIGLADRVEFIGQANRSQVYDLLSSCEMLAIPSVVASNGDQEGTPVVLAEAVALDVPVVASRLGGLGDWLDDDSGWLVEPGDHTALAAALTEVHRSPIERERRATTAGKEVSPSLTLEGTAEAYTALYQELLP